MEDMPEVLMYVRTGETCYSDNSHLQDLTLFFFPQSLEVQVVLIGGK